MLIATSSLAAAATAYGVKTQKSYFPNSYVQNVESLSELLKRIHSDVRWEKLETHMDWFNDVKKKDLQYRVQGRSFEQWMGRTGDMEELRAFQNVPLPRAQ